MRKNGENIMSFTQMEPDLRKRETAICQSALNSFRLPNV